MTIATALNENGSASGVAGKNQCFVPMASGASASLIAVEAPALTRVRDTPRRFIVLISAALFMLGNYYFYDQTSATKATLQDHTGMSENTFGLLSSVYSWPNVVLPLFGGMFIDRFGVRTAVVFFTALVAIGSSLFSVGLWSVSVPLLVFARVLFGMGGESQNVSALSLVSKWFGGRELAFAMAIIVSVSRLGSVFAFRSQGMLVENVGVIIASGFGTCICLFSLLTGVLVVILDWRADRRDAARGFDSTKVETDEAAQLTDIFKLGKLFWLVSLSCVSVYVAAFPFMQVVSAPYLAERFGYSQEEADGIVANINLTSAFLSPVLGLVVDKFGRRPMLLTVSSLIFVACHLTFLLFPHCDHCGGIVGVYILMGIALSVYGAVVWPCIPLTVKPEMVGTAFGITTALQNMGMALSTMLLSYLHSATGSFNYPFACIVGSCAVGCTAGCAVWILDHRGDKRLSLVGEENPVAADPVAA